MTPIYKKVGRRYVEIGQCDNEAFYYPHGSHLVVARKGSTLTRYNIDPDHAAIEAALQHVREAMMEAMAEATKFKLEKRAYTKKELSGIAAFHAIVGDMVPLQFEGVSMSDVVEAGIKILKNEATQ